MLCLHKILTSGTLHSGVGYDMIEWLVVELFCHALAGDPKIDSGKNEKLGCQENEKSA